MNDRKLWLFPVLLVTCYTVTYASGIAELIEQTSKQFIPASTPIKNIFITNTEEKENELVALSDELAVLKKEEPALNAKTTNTLDQLKHQITHIKEALHDLPARESVEKDFLDKKLIALNEHYRLIKEYKKLYEKRISNLERNIELHKAYRNDPHGAQLETELGIKERSQFTFEQFQDISQRINDQEKIIAQLNDQKKNVQLELENSKQDALLLTDANNKKIMKMFDDSFEFDAQQQKVLTDIETKLDQDRKAIAQLRKNEVEQRKELIKMELFLAELHLDKCKSLLKIIKPHIKIQEASITQAHETLLKKRQLFFDSQEAYDQRIELIVQRQKEIEKTIESLAQQSPSLTGPDLDDWSKEPLQSIHGYYELFEIASLNTSILLLQRQREYLELQRALADRILKEESIYLDIKTTFQKLISHKLTTDEILYEKNKYEGARTRAKADLTACTTQKGEADVHLERQKKALANLHNKRQTLRTQRTIIFKHNSSEYNRCLELLNSVEAKIKRQIDLISKSISIDEESIAAINKTLKHITFIMSELDGEVMWGRSAHAVSWDGIRKAWSDFLLFVKDIRQYTKNISFTALWTSIDFVRVCIYLVIMLLFILFVLCLFKLFIFVIHVAGRYEIQHPLLFLTYMIGLLLAQYLSRYFIYWLLWIIAYFILHLCCTTPAYPLLIFYLISIVYLTILEYVFVRDLKHFNAHHGYIFFGSAIEKQILFILSILLYSTTTMMCLRTAFLLSTITDSELPAILLATNVIIFQIALIFLLAISIEQISGTIPTKTESLLHMRSVIDRYYYLILIFLTAIMIMSNPSVGFGNLVLHLLGRTILTILMIFILLVIYNFLKNIASRIFFYSDNAVVRERFAHGKTWYGLFIIVLFLTFISLGAISAAKIWGWPKNIATIHGWSDILAWLNSPIMFEKTADVPISVFSILQVVSFILAGIMVALALNRIVFEKIFDVLMVESGAQNAISSIASYVIVALATMFGFQAVGRGDLVIWILGAFAFGLSWIVKDPLSDFIAYFIILVQRPIKIGDYIWLDEINMGVVRKITPRAVIIRKQNSTMIIIPNMTIITKPLINWNYQRGFIAFEDIKIRIACKHDPYVVKSIFEQVVADNSFILKTPKPIVRLEEFDEYGFMFIVRGYISTNYTLERWDIASDIRLAITKELKKNNIEFATRTELVVTTKASDYQQTEETR